MIAVLFLRMRTWATTALIVGGITAILLVVVNVVLGRVFEPDRSGVYQNLENKVVDAWVARYDVATLKRVYPGKTEEQILDLLRETSVIPVVYEPYVLFRSAPRAMAHHAIHEAGFRLVGPEQGPWPMDRQAFNVFVFGGSTAFGYGVPDVDTVPSRLQGQLRKAAGSKQVNLYNFGTGSYYSTQEVIYFQRLLAKGYVPDAVVFIDGLNDFWRWDDIPVHNERYVNIFNNAEGENLGNPSHFFRRWIKSLPMTRLAQRLAAPEPQMLMAPERGAEAGAAPVDSGEACRRNQATLREKAGQHDNPQKLRQAIDTYTRNKAMAEAIAERFKIAAYFVWQPIPTFEYDRCHSVFHGDLQEHFRSMFGYPMMVEHARENRLGKNFIWCASIQSGERRNFYVDNVHYNADMAELLSRCIVENSGLADRAKAKR